MNLVASPNAAMARKALQEAARGSAASENGMPRDGNGALAQEAGLVLQTLHRHRYPEPIPASIPQTGVHSPDLVAEVAVHGSMS
ncbi:hypothetical protein [Amycolatopsis pigmentata]|uniref:Uncharacterized protein n=1 Tax=Amycolatopsis pigmentata TaxID=450801 RepID=A0ABW5G6A5_9PSEU